LDKVIDTCPIIGKIYDTVDSFIKGVRRDKTAKNAIRFEYNNRLTEENVDKLIANKQIMYAATV
jgi:uncharacterized membrane protein